MSDDDRTTVSVSTATRDRLDDVAPPGPSWDDRVNALLDEVEGSSAEAPADVATTGDLERLHEVLREDLDALREDVVAQVPHGVADELESRRR